jgi:hypothetical protein
MASHLPGRAPNILFKNDAGVERALDPTLYVRYMFFRISVMLQAPLTRPRGAGDRIGMQECSSSDDACSPVLRAGRKHNATPYPSRPPTQRLQASLQFEEAKGQIFRKKTEGSGNQRR